jgi:hypothetical protein
MTDSNDSPRTPQPLPVWDDETTARLYATLHVANGYAAQSSLVTNGVHAAENFANVAQSSAVNAAVSETATAALAEQIAEMWSYIEEHVTHDPPTPEAAPSVHKTTTVAPCYTKAPKRRQRRITAPSYEAKTPEKPE